MREIMTQFFPVKWEEFFNEGNYVKKNSKAKPRILKLFQQCILLSLFYYFGNKENIKSIFQRTLQNKIYFESLVLNS